MHLAKSKWVWVGMSVLRRKNQVDFWVVCSAVAAAQAAALTWMRRVSCLMPTNKMVDAIWFGQLQSKDSSIQHTGDNRTGAGDGDDEVINVNLSRIPDHVQALVFTVNSFTGQTFATVNNAFCRLVNASNNSEVARYDLSAQVSHTALILAKIYRHNGEWKMHAIGETASGRTFHDLMPAILPHV